MGEGADRCRWHGGRSIATDAAVVGCNRRCRINLQVKRDIRTVRGGSAGVGRGDGTQVRAVQPLGGARCDGCTHSGSVWRANKRVLALAARKAVAAVP